MLSQEGAQVVGVNSSVVVSIDGPVSSKGGEVVPDFEVSLASVESPLKVNFSLNDLNEGHLDVSGKVLVSADSVGGSVECDVSEEVVFAGKDHLQVTKDRE